MNTEKIKNIMKKVIRLTESDFTRLVHKIINEQVLLTKLPFAIQSAIKKLEQTYGVKIEDSHIQSELSQEGNYYPDNGGENPEARQQINKLVAKIHQLFPKTKNLGVISGYRGYSKQSDVFGRNVAAQGGVSNRQKNVTLPGFSQHHTGKAFDISVIVGVLISCGKWDCNLFFQNSCNQSCQI